MYRRSLLAGATAGVGLAALGTRAGFAQTPGVTATELKIGHINAFSGPASAYGAIGMGLIAFFKMVNDQGGVGGRKINFITADDGYVPARAVEQARKLVEQDEVAFTLNNLGTPSNSATQKYMNAKKVPQLFVATGADKWGNYKQFPWTIGWQPSYRIEAQIYAKDILKNAPGAKVGVLYQNDDFGKDYLAGLKDVLGDKYDAMVRPASYEVTDATIDSQAVQLQSAGCDVLLVAATPKFAAQIIRKVFDMAWKPRFYLTNVSVSTASVMIPAGVEKGVGVISVNYYKDPNDPKWKNDAGVNEWRAFMTKYLPDANQADTNYIFAWSVGLTAMAALKQCNGDFSRENIMKQATNLKDVVIPTLLPGVLINTSPTNYHPIRQMQMMRWTGSSWELFGDIIEGAGE